MRLIDKDKKPILVIASLILFFTWAVWTFSIRSNFETISSVDPLAMIHTLFPGFWILLMALGLVCIGVIRWAADARWLHLLLLSQLALFLFFTPFILSGFSWSPDSLWHAGVASYMPEILSGSKLPYASYAEGYPLSFMMTYIVRTVSGIDVFSYTLYVYPLIAIVAITGLAYIFASRVLNPRNGFLAMLFALPALHYIEPHVSPFSAGTVLVLAFLVLLTVEGRLSRVLNLSIIVAVVLVHPISPISLGIFLFAAVVAGVLYRNVRADRRFIFRGTDLASNLLFLGIVWLAWTTTQGMSTYPSVEYAISYLVTFRFLKRTEYASQFTVGGGGFIYSGIFELTLAVYGIFLILISFPLLLDLVRSRFGLKRELTIGFEPYTRIVLAFSSILYAIFGYMLLLATGQRFLLGRGLLFYIIIGSICISAYLVRQNASAKIFKKLISIVLIAFLLLTFPVLSYSKEAYNTYVPSHGYGLTFIASNIDVSKQSLSMSADQQLASYVDLTKGVLIKTFPPSLNQTTADFIVLGRDWYFARAMRVDLSFEDNRYTQLVNDLSERINYDLVYNSPAFEMYSSNALPTRL